MTIRSHFIQLFLLVAVFAHISVGVNNGYGFVWCFSATEDARVEINPLMGCETSHPCDNGRAEEGLGDQEFVAPEPSGDCLDIPTLSQYLHRSSRLSLDVDLSSLTTTIIIPPPVQFIFSSPPLKALIGFHPQPPPPLHPTLALLRTVVLTI